MRKHAPIMTAFIFTSKSMGNWIPKLSASVKASLRSPVHCLLIFPILLTSSMVRICRGAERTRHAGGIGIKLSVAEERSWKQPRSHPPATEKAGVASPVMILKQLEEKGDGNIMFQWPMMWRWWKVWIVEPTPPTPRCILMKLAKPWATLSHGESAQRNPSHQARPWGGGHYQSGRLNEPTSKSTSGRQLHPQKGPWIFRTGSLCSLATTNFGEKGCHCCMT